MSPTSATASALSSTACFSIVAEAQPGLLLRVLELFAKRGLPPCFCCSRVEGDEISIDLQISGFGPSETAHAAACFRQNPAVKTVLTFERTAPVRRAVSGSAANRDGRDRIRRRA